MFRKSYEVTGWAPRDGGYLLCVDCHGKLAHTPGHSFEVETINGKMLDCDCGAVFLSSETDSAQCCDTCFAIIETTVIGQCDECDCADPTAMQGLADECDCACH